MVTRFTAEARGGVLQGLYGGLTLVEACGRAGVPVKTVKGWLTRGRAESETAYATFAQAVDEARDVAARADMALPEFRGHLNKAVRAGSIAAMRLWLDVFDRQDGREPDAVDELLRRRAERRASVLDRLDHQNGVAAFAALDTDVYEENHD